MVSGKKILLAGLLAVVGLALCNYGLLLPRLAREPEPAPPLPRIEDLPTPPVAKQVATTMDLVKKLAAARPPAPRPLFKPRLGLRNPFLEGAAGQSRKRGPAAAPALPQVRMVMIAEGGNRALLDDTLLTEGDVYRGRRLARISADGVLWQGRDGTTFLPLGRYAEYAAPVAPPRQASRRIVKSDPAAADKGTARGRALLEFLGQLEPLLSAADQARKAE